MEEAERRGGRVWAVDERESADTGRVRLRGEASREVEGGKGKRGGRRGATLEGSEREGEKRAGELSESDPGEFGGNTARPETGDGSDVSALEARASGRRVQG